MLSACATASPGPPPSSSAVFTDPALSSQVDEELQIKAYYAGHVLGAAMFQIRVGSESVVYTVSGSMVRGPPGQGEEALPECCSSAGRLQHDPGPAPGVSQLVCWFHL